MHSEDLGKQHYPYKFRFFFLEYAKDLRIIVIKVEEFNHTNDALQTSALGGLGDIYNFRYRQENEFLVSTCYAKH